MFKRKNEKKCLKSFYTCVQSILLKGKYSIQVLFMLNLAFISAIIIKTKAKNKRYNSWLITQVQVLRVSIYLQQFTYFVFLVDIMTIVHE